MNVWSADQCMCCMSVWPFQIGSKTHSDCQPVVDSPQTEGWCLVLGDVLQTSPY